MLRYGNPPVGGMNQRTYYIYANTDELPRGLHLPQIMSLPLASSHRFLVDRQLPKVVEPSPSTASAQIGYPFHEGGTAIIM